MMTKTIGSVADVLFSTLLAVSQGSFPPNSRRFIRSALDHDHGYDYHFVSNPAAPKGAPTPPAIKLLPTCDVFGVGRTLGPQLLNLLPSEEL